MGRRSSPGVKGFRPGKEPPQLRKRAAKQQLGDLNAAQERMVDLFSERTPEESRKMLAKWRTMSLAAGVALSVLTVVALMWTPIAGVIVGILATVAFFLHLRLRAQREALEAMADAVSKGGNKSGRSRRRG